MLSICTSKNSMRAGNPHLWRKISRMSRAGQTGSAFHQIHTLVFLSHPIVRVLVSYDCREEMSRWPAQTIPGAVNAAERLTEQIIS